MTLALFTIVSAPGPKDFTRGPDFASLSFLSGPLRLLFGIVLAALILYSAFQALKHLFVIGGAGGNTHKAREGGIGIAFALIAIIIAYSFQDILLGMISSLVA